eukprot:CAMPEP_0181356368 /NCGR_PEP_ID=MMETSP1106-20121128/4389_1 /TAXON_ID=81844 /ORGANISM="Mantoniella antarctica, Strain SL-175" /LENGTH=267 /DNA_ID=CAMNT_0023469157 /DNA_START=60 /DNA_END=863 /DNA_ORIENTATION=-
MAAVASPSLASTAARAATIGKRSLNHVRNHHRLLAQPQQGGCLSEASSASILCDTAAASAAAAAAAAAAVPARAFARRAVLTAAVAALSASAAPTPLARANPFDDFAEGQLANKAKFFMGPPALSLERLDALQASEVTLTVDELAVVLGKATLDCLNPRGPLAAYANVRDVCTLNILVRSVTKGPAVTNAAASAEAMAVTAAARDLEKSYDELAAELALDQRGDSRDAAFRKSKVLIRQFAAALLACFRLSEARNAATEAAFPALFA